MNTHALGATTTRQPNGWPTTEEWIAHIAAVTLAWSALDAAVREEIGYTHHLTVWFAVLELEGRGTERINSPPTRAMVAELTGEIRTTDLILTSLERLTEAGVLESSEMKDWRG